MVNKTILTDIDEVILQWSKSFEEWIVKNITYNPENRLESAYSIENWLNIDFEETRDLIYRFNNSNHFSNLEPYPKSVEYIEKLHNEGCNFIAITSCGDNEDIHNMRINNIRTYFGEIFDVIHCLGIGEDKTKYLKMYNKSWWIDDKVENVIDGMNVGHKSIIMTQPYNLDYNHDNVTRVNDWEDIYEIIALNS